MFSGCGGFDLGFQGDFFYLDKYYHKQPFDIVFANEIDRAAVHTYRLNISMDILRENIATAINKLPSHVDILIGGFPCQDVSMLGLRAIGKGKNTSLFSYILEAAAKLQPKLIVCENVTGIMKGDSKPFFQYVIHSLRRCGYKVTHSVLNAANFGVPQKRRRVFIVASRKELTANFMFPRGYLDKSQWVTCYDAMHDLAELPPCKYCDHVWTNWSLLGMKMSKYDTFIPERAPRDAPCRTILATGGKCRFHYEKDRALSVRELARLQSFPDTFLFPCPVDKAKKQIGNSVSPLVAWHLADSARMFLNDSQ